MLEPTHEEAGDYFSASRLTTYMICPNKYLFNYVEKQRKEQLPAPMMFGSAVHKTIEAIYQRLMDKATPMTVEEVKDEAAGFWMAQTERAFNESERGVGYTEKESEDLLKDRIVKLMEVFVSEFDMPDEVNAIEQRFRCWIFDPETGERLDLQFLGIVDAITTRGGEQIIEEHKTAGRRWSRHDYENNLQASLYLAAHPLGELRFNVLVKRANPVVEVFHVQANDWQQNDAVNTMCNVIKAVEDRNFYPRRGYMCDRCSFRRRCYEGS